MSTRTGVGSLCCMAAGSCLWGLVPQAIMMVLVDQSWQLCHVRVDIDDAVACWPAVSTSANSVHSHTLTLTGPCQGCAVGMWTDVSRDEQTRRPMQEVKNRVVVSVKGAR